MLDRDYLRIQTRKAAFLLGNRRRHFQFSDDKNQWKEDDVEAGAEIEKEKKLETKKTGMQKFLSGFLKFLTMGGFFVILILIVGIMILISYLTKWTLDLYVSDTPNPQGYGRIAEDYFSHL